MTTNLDEYKGVPTSKDESTGQSALKPPGQEIRSVGGSEPNLAIKGSFRDMLNHSVGKFLVILNTSGRPDRIEAICASFTKRMDNLINIFDPWDQFLTNVNFFKNDETDLKFQKMSEKLHECLGELLTAEGCQTIMKAFSTSSDFKVRNMLVRDVFNTEISKRFGSQDFVFDIVAENLAEKAKLDSDTRKTQAAGDKGEEKANFSFMTVTPVIDPVNGIPLSSAKPGDHILVEGPAKLEKINCPIASITPSEIEGRFVVYVNVEGNVMGKMVLSRTTMLARPDSETTAEVGKDVIWFIIVAVFLLLAFLFGVLYYIF
ncbi:MAG: hypothetical protein CVV64_17505 [Candidatus Wallbacteria bacterium HGW-Wallbacteria-1]|jgi:hypothetical protein|uniref:Uncharacterized protein n=1 Tax=Candidatus Wallbacteria bacterium HGW-Wallbacteria-1 TaxID=2013854 RepID=A0A2N1PK44_9BACT|nr:MAG: hypothetical protein CVV64_17505 [Candidatus Wallbacteria bacterium HGW-Wallbacteria-1]